MSPARGTDRREQAMLAAVSAAASELPRTRRALERGIAEGLHLGGQVYVSRSGRPVADFAFGERGPGETMTTDTLMIWMSSTKPVAAVAIAQLWERGLLGLDDPVARSIPEFAERGKDRITLRHVLTHTGGFRLLNVGWPEASWDEIVARICDSRPEPRWEPGRKAGYHLASSWFILGEVVRRLDGRPFNRYVREEVFEPLGMADSWVGMPYDRYLAYGPRLGKMYDTENGKCRARTLDREPHVVGCSPGGNGHGPIRELGRFYDALLVGGEWDGRRILRPQTVEALIAPHRVGMWDQTFKAYLDWGLGFIVNTAPGSAVLRPPDRPQPALLPYGYGRHASPRTFGHSGFQSSTAFADPVHRLVVAIVVNGNPGEPRHTERFRDVTEAIYEDLDLATDLDLDQEPPRAATAPGILMPTPADASSH